MTDFSRFDSGLCPPRIEAAQGGGRGGESPSGDTDDTSVVLRHLRSADTREQAAVSYRAAIRTRPDVDWPTVNRYLIERWSASGLSYIKRKAWA